MNIEEEIALALAKRRGATIAGAPDEWVAADLMPLVKRAQAEAGAKALRGYRTRLMDQNIDRCGIVLPDLHEVLDDLEEEADRIEQEAGA